MLGGAGVSVGRGVSVGAAVSVGGGGAGVSVAGTEVGVSAEPFLWGSGVSLGCSVGVCWYMGGGLCAGIVGCGVSVGGMGVAVATPTGVDEATACTVGVTWIGASPTVVHTRAEPELPAKSVA